MIHKRERNDVFREDLCHDRPGCETSRQASTLDMPAEEGRDEIGGAEDVETSAEERGGDAVCGTAVPGDLRLVNSEMGRDGTGEALFCEDLVVGLGFGDGGCFDESVTGGRSVTWTRRV